MGSSYELRVTSCELLLLLLRHYCYSSYNLQPVTRNSQPVTPTMRRTNDHSLKDAIQHLLTAYKLKGKVLETRLLGEWETLVGNTVARYTDDLFVREKILYVKVSNGTIKQELLYSKEELLKRLNDFAGEKALNDIVIR